ncbi:MAG: acyltransferase [Bacteroidetes bacterium]|nr:acyltransferase [Bacteroidota bacterium]
MRSILKYFFLKLGGRRIKSDYLNAKEEFVRELEFKKKYKHTLADYFVHPTAILEDPSLITIECGTEIFDYVIIRTQKNKVNIGRNTQINPFTVIYGGSGVSIGSNVMIAPHCMIASGNHDFKQTQFPMRFAGSLSKGPIVIEDNVWIGANCTITDGVRIGKESVVAANSVVTKDVEPWSIVSGVPAVKISSRLPK